MTPIRATARLQLHVGFTLHDAAARVPYYAALGVSHLYLSPIGAAVPGSTHGYDAIDPTRVNPELGGEEALGALVERLRTHGLRLVLDIVPNHVAAHPDNPWWWDVLRHGRDSRHADWFDIDWDAPGCDRRLWLPVLEAPLATMLAQRKIEATSAGDEPLLTVGDQRFPLTVDTWPDTPSARAHWLHALDMDTRAGGERLRQLLERQPYRLAWWRTGNDRVNYRRFFDITSLVALRTEREDVFDAVHALPLRLIRDGVVDALRIDHVDGLADPRGYLHRLRAAVGSAARECDGADSPVAIHVEKILAPGESLPHDWPCDGTTGYDFMDQVGGLLHDGDGEAPLRALWRQRSGRSGDFAIEEHEARRQMLAGPLHSEFLRTLRALQVAADADDVARELGASLLARGLTALLARFPVYRTYAAPDGLHGDDAARFDAAVDAAKADADTAVGEAIDAIARLVRDRSDADALRALRQRIEHLTAPLNAKAVEDTAFYRHGVLLSRNEVGSHPTHFATSVDAFHAACIERAKHWPHALLITASHDHKRGEDVRARLAVLSERPDGWASRVEAFEALATPLRDDARAPSPGDTLMLWQMLVGAWPLDLSPDDAQGLDAFARRIAQWQQKAMREAKLATSWTQPDGAYESAADALLRRILTAHEGADLRAALHEAAMAIAPAGAVNGLAQTVLRLTVPGTPDLYQGTEGWDFSLVDPDNRRPVPYARNQAWLGDDAPWQALLERWRDGAIKARTIARLLQLRACEPALFARGTYEPVHCDDMPDAKVMAFHRRDGNTGLFVAVPRCIAPWLDGTQQPLPPPERWGRATFTLQHGRWRHVLDERTFDLADGRIALAELFRHSPVAVLIQTP
ncbi:malto-oligosyltrehalose synthase [Lysobacter auxotrophicus]|uniref:Malto-oligosyltrehalose synthase n=1 Tax=Lysobacter auxotrophicus TaxID=2992573 RepID=A0ABN6UJV3_9GAMM|nr:malto-oligosyltrehalose synthase [Lysobacter auxotrophicus]BDU16529.1 malto-oligosyltrehalose synthase [Lysobacter auxotrophicus]